MKLISPQLLAYLKTRDATHHADLFRIQLVTGKVITATNCQVNVDFGFPPVTYFATKYGAWERGTITSEVAFTPRSNDCSLTMLADETMLFPGTSLPLTKAVAIGLFDAAEVSIYSFYYPIGQMPSVGLAMGFLTSTAGQITSFDQAGRSKIVFKVSDPNFLLNLQTPQNLIQSPCRFTLFDEGCTLNEDDFTDVRTVAADSTQSILFPNTPFVFAFAQGKVKFTEGDNVGIPYSIKQVNLDGSISLASPLLFPVTVGETFKATSGCDKTFSRCSQLQGTVNAPLNFGGMKTVPVPETSI